MVRRAICKRGNALLLLTGASAFFGACQGLPTGGLRSAISPPVLVSAEPDCVPLTRAQVQDIVGRAGPLCPKGRGIWFIFVHYNDTVKKPGHYRATVYFSPDVQTARMRKGRSVYVTNDDAFPPEEFSAFLVRKPSVAGYIQVSDVAEKFGAALAVPTARTLPFSPGEPISDVETVAVVDFLRSLGDEPWIPNTSVTLPDGTIETSVTLPSRVERDSPILSIRVHEDVIEVRFGWIAGPLHGGGTTVTVRRVPGGFRVEYYGVVVVVKSGGGIRRGLRRQGIGGGAGGAVPDGMGGCWWFTRRCGDAEDGAEGLGVGVGFWGRGLLAFGFRRDGKWPRMHADSRGWV